MFDTAIEQAKADAIPRYAQPMEDDEQKTGSCWNCDHMVEVVLGGQAYRLCVSERDYTASGEVDECDDEVTECVDWEKYRWA